MRLGMFKVYARVELIGFLQHVDVFRQTACLVVNPINDGRSGLRRNDGTILNLT